MLGSTGDCIVKCGSYFHQLRPISSALSTEHTSSRIRIVSSSTFANAIRTSPAITNPLSRTRSRISTRFVVPVTVGTRSMAVFLSAKTLQKHPFRAPDAKCISSRMSTHGECSIEPDCAGNFAELGIHGCWLSLPELLKIFCRRNFSIRRQYAKNKRNLGGPRFVWRGL
jgi:hypothetical protein